MAVWDPPQPVWKRNLVGILDFLLAFVGFGFLLATLGFGTRLQGGFNFGPGPSLLLLLMIVAYFAVLGRTGGTVFQRLFGMKRAAHDEPRASLSAESPLWRYNLASILDFLLASIVFIFLLAGLGLAKFQPTPQGMPGMTLEYGPLLVLLAYIFAYFVGLRRTGGTIFQRLLKVKRKGKAVWDPPQPSWKRNLAGILDFLLAAIGLGVILNLLSPGIIFEVVGPPERAIKFGIPWQMMLLPALVVGYFAVLGGTGGTVFQRVFGMKRRKLRKEDDEIVRQF
jgi:hypothetical protein